MNRVGYIFFDTEFENFATLGLLSIGCVSESGEHEFYEEVSDFNRKECSEFVNKVVLPLMGAHPIPLIQVQERLKSWINQLPYDEVIFVSDYGGDEMILQRLLNTKGEVALQKKVGLQLMQKAFSLVCKERVIYKHLYVNKSLEVMLRGVEEYLKKDPQRQHHALFDAKANLHGWRAALRFMSNC